ncbi:AAA family ATPase [Luteolibacter luteus]|uniref:AAA family ATPase n=1 Tax=Luteolibacter luteus TaxID=2728835 RepID=A0A858RDY7_9BACT|nr:AAA family ATPase [Luteolibacter luteus]QJE94784.1 AAA family ATPase [Luteolibacter luteus]
MIENWIAAKRVIVTGAERLYPDGIDWNLSPGVNAIIGGTGLGKTTLVYALQFAIFGKMIVDSAERVEKEFFRNRLTNRDESETKKAPPLVTVEFDVGPKKFTVKRNLLSGAIVSARCNEKPLNQKGYEAALPQAIGIDGDFASLSRLQGNLFFFGESRRLLAWENRLQHELANLLLADHETYRRLEHLWGQVESADSFARNISSQASRLEKDLEQLTAKNSNVLQLEQLSKSQQLSQEREQMELRVNSLSKKLANDEKLSKAQGDHISILQNRFHEELASLEDAIESQWDDNFLATAITSPTAGSIRHSLEKFYLDPRARGCPCCGRPGMEAHLAKIAITAAKDAQKGSCIICNKDIAEPKPKKSEGLKNAQKSTDIKADQLQKLLFEREQTLSRINEYKTALSISLQQLAVISSAELKHARENPISDGENLRVAISQMRKRERQARVERDRHLLQLNEELASTNEGLDRKKSLIATAFKKYATLYLDESCDVKFLNETELPRKRGPQIKAPHAAFFPVISGQTRPSAQALSDAQRSFVDLAFRMAMIDVWHQETDGTITMIIETPEGAVDIAYMERVASMIRKFSAQGHTLIITTNLNNEIFLPHVMARRPSDERDKHILNLLEKGNPRPVQRKNKPYFDRILASVKTTPRTR